MRHLVGFAAMLGVACAGGSAKDDAPATGDTQTGPSAVDLLAFDGGVQANLPFVAFQDGDGPWEEVVGSAGRYTLASTLSAWRQISHSIVCPWTLARLSGMKYRCG